MKGLLQSKRFRSNLYKWLIAYVGVMLLLSTVITYSKYISSFLEQDKAVPARFDIAIKQLNCLDTTTGETCNPSSYWSTLPIAYYFTVDTSNLEVTTKMKVTLDVNSDFEVEKVEEITNLEAISDSNGTIIDLENIATKNLDISNKTKNNLILLPNYDNIVAKTGGKKGYRVLLKYIGTNDTDRNINILKVNYAAEQIDTDQKN